MTEVDMPRQVRNPSDDVPWWRRYGDVLTPALTTCVGLEAEATSLAAFEAQVVHGLLQTGEYARAVLQAVHPADSDALLADRVELRLVRQAVLERAYRPLRVHLVLDEAVLHRAVGGPVVMCDQLRHLSAVAERENVTIQVLRYRLGEHAGLAGSFGIFQLADALDPGVVYAESPAGIAYLDRPQDRAHFRELFARLAMSAAPPPASVDLIRGLADSWSSGLRDEG